MIGLQYFLLFLIANRNHGANRHQPHYTVVFILYFIFLMFNFIYIFTCCDAEQGVICYYHHVIMLIIIRYKYNNIIIKIMKE